MEIKNKIEDLLKEVFKDFGIESNNFILEHPADITNGDYSTNIILTLKKEQLHILLEKNKENSIKAGNENFKNLAADFIIDELKKRKPKEIEDIKIAGPGFINFYLSQEFFVNSVKEIIENKNFGQNNLFANKKIMVEYTQPNPFKPFHIGHLMSNAIGESVSRIVEFSGAKTVRANYQGDIGPHVAKAIYGLLKFGMPDESESVTFKAQYIGELYAKGHEAYETDPEAKKEIEKINRKIYDRSDEKINDIYDWGRRITLEAFEEIYKILGTSFNYYFFESVVAPIGLEIVSKNTPDVFEKSDGAIVFHAEKHDPKLHTRVFVNSQGLPTYETKELGLTKTKFEKEKLDMSIVITANEQEEYMKVVTKALEMISSDIASKMKHIVHGMMRLSSGKMSSRKGNVITGESLILESCAEISEKIKDRDFTDAEKKQISNDVGVSAVKYSILKQDIGGNIIYDFEKSISFEGDSGPYLQYSYARANSIIEKAKLENILPGFLLNDGKVDLLPLGDIEKLLYRFPEVVFRSALEFEPHYIANYLIDISRAFNNYYGNTKIIDKDDMMSPYKIALTLAFSLVMKNGLYLLGIKAPERM